MRLDGQHQGRLVRGQRGRQQGRERDIALAHGDEAPRRIGVVLEVQNVRERQQSRQIGC